MNTLMIEITEYDRIKKELDNGEEELIPADVVHAILDGANPVRTWREYRGFTQHDLAAKVGISTAYLSQIETGKRTGTSRVLASIARILNVDIDDLLPIENEDEIQ